MQVIYVNGVEKIDQDKPVSACIGHFDGVHRGHQALINDTKRISKELNILSAVITFDPDPSAVLNHQQTKLITTLNERLAIFKEFEIDIVIVIKFDNEIANQEPNEFIIKVLNHLNLRSLTCGFDFTFGYLGKATANTLLNSELIDYPINIIEEVSYQGRKISSTWINELLSLGNIKMVNELLNHPFAIIGKVVKGHQVGKKLNFPTANIEYISNQSLPKIGVYIGQVKVKDHIYSAMINVGNNPTFYNDHKITIEAHILNFSEDIYDIDIRVIFLSYLREEIKFDSADQLVKQLNDDLNSVKSYFDSHSNNSL
ncbi:MAG: bifunctional riboflavin kinase/FAD synthetase [Erysipelotrichaceae bacterium]|nr:bifunctional riboflavin kinase/FAD synthetase [Erysipelotrichaceae bacterium]MDD4642213.1 bifunctional riboflavin kinase/FAD synthetase [Erysipelotrichaceae bacterium]